MFYGGFENNPLSCDSNRRVPQMWQKLFPFFTLKMVSALVVETSTILNKDYTFRSSIIFLLLMK